MKTVSSPEKIYRPMCKPVDIKAHSNYKLWLRYSDGVEGEVDLSHLAGKGVFAFWNNYKNFEKAHIGTHGQIIWNDEIEMCSDSLYLRLTGKTPEEVFPRLREIKADA